MNCKKRFLGLVLSMTTLVGTLALTTNASDSVKSAVGIVDASALRLREGPGTDTEILTTAYRNDYVVILTGTRSFTTCGRVICTATT